jgi:hypothetical protein
MKKWLVGLLLFFSGFFIDISILIAIGGMFDPLLN